MVYRSRKRIQAIPRGPDGSAFQNCESCGLSVAIALADMHDCELMKGNTRKRQKIQDQPRSAFHFFMEEFVKTFKDGNDFERDKKGFETWKNMSKEERQPFVLQAEKVNSAYLKLLLQEESEIEGVDDEADSAEVGKYDESFETSDMYCYDSGCSAGSGFFFSETCDTLDTKFLLEVCPWATPKSP